MSVAIFLTSRLILARGFASIERENVSQAVERARLGLRDRIDTIATTALDWGSWDDSYRYVQDRNPQFARANLTDVVIANVKLDVILFFDRSGHLVFSRHLTPELKADPVRADEASKIAKLLPRCLEGRSVSGLIASGHGLLLIAARPILTSAETGPPAGMLVMGRHLSEGEISELSGLTLTRIALREVAARDLPVDFGRALVALGTRGRRSYIAPLGGNQIAGYSLISDVNGAPAAIIRAEIPRNVWREGNRAMLCFSIAVLISMAAFAAAIDWLMQRVVVSRLGALTATIRKIASSRDASQRVSPDGRDELASLAETLNLMLASIERSADELRENQTRLKTVLDSVQAGIVVVDARTHQILDINDAALAIVGYPREALVGHSYQELICPSVEVPRGHVAGLRGEAGAVERVLLRADGSPVPVLKRSVEIELDGSRCILESFLDITDRKRAEEAMRYQAYHDGLTALPNRRWFQDRVTEELAQASQKGTKVAVMLLDLDRFKTINDTLGHSIGDKLLQAVGARLASCLRAEDSVARIGGDEFGLVLTDVQDGESTTRVARRVLERVRPAFQIDGLDLHTTASIGISTFPGDGVTVEEMMQRADVALYHAKDQGRDTYRNYASWIDASARTRLTMENSLRRALERGEFVLHYQPQVRVPTLQIVGLEALIRWQHPEMGMLMPNEFLPVAEESGLIQPIGEWVVAEACRQSRAWQDEGLEPMRIAVNLSASQFRHQRLHRVVETAIREAALSPELLELEMTETAVMMNVGMGADLMARLKAVGVRLCLDDFGVGNTSLVRLKQFPIDTVKVDGSFLRTVDINPTDAAIVSAIIGIGDSLGLLVIGEGVELPGQMRFLRERGCNTMQGFLFSRPRSAEDAARILRGSLRAETIHPR